MEAAAGIDGGRIWNVSYDPGNAKVAYAASFGGGVFKSVDGAATWFASSTGLGENLCVLQVYVHPAVTNTLFASAATCDRKTIYERMGTFDLYRSVDAGATWQKATPAGVLNPLGDFVVFASKASASIVYVRNGNQLWRSLDGGGAFAPRNVPSSRDFDGAVADPTQADVLFATLDVGLGVPHRTVRSADGGATWTDVAIPASYSATKLWFSPADHALWATMTTNAAFEFWASKDDGATWQRRLGQSSCVSDILALAPSNAQRVYSASNSQLCRTNDQGTDVQTIAAPQYAGNAAVDMAVSPANADEWLLASAELYRSVDAGQTIVESQAGITNRTVQALVIAPSNDQILYAGGRGRVFRSVDAAKTWHRRGSGLPIGFEVTALAVHPLDPNIVYAGLFGREINAQPLQQIVSYVYKSIDGGSTFQKLDALTLNAEVWSGARVSNIVVDANNPSHVSVLTASELIMSTNDGLTWGRILSSVGGGRFSVHPTQPSTVVLVQRDAFGTATALRSGDAGLTFASWMVPAKTFDVAFDAAVPSKVYACTTDGPKVSSDDGVSWSSALVGLVSQDTEAVECRRLFQTRTGGHIYMADHQGALWITKNGATSWTRTKGVATYPGGQALATFGGEQAIAIAVADGKDPDVVYLGLRASVGIAKSTTGGL
jgi:photosystem II stability/assembly factor-like uncharacterized protein